MAAHMFRAELWEHSPDEPGSWHFVTLPAEVSEEIILEGGPREGFGSIRVEARIGATTWRTSLFPDSASGRYVLPVKRPVRHAENLRAGTPYDVTLEVVAGR